MRINVIQKSILPFAFALMLATGLARAQAPNWALWPPPAGEPASPSGRETVLAYDSVRQRTVLFGGSAGNQRFGDTWEWDGFVWAQRAPANSPSPRTNHAMAYDAARQRVVMFGGYDGTILGDTWEW